MRDQLGRRIELPRAKDLSAKERSAGLRAGALGEALQMSLSGCAAGPAQVAAWSVGNSADSRRGLTVAQCNLALVLAGAPWPPSCCSSRMNHDELRARIRQLIASGDLPTVPSLASGTLAAPAGIRRIIIGRSLPDPCLICGEANPTVAYTYANGRVVFLHAACDALWRQEREAEA